MNFLYISLCNINVLIPHCGPALFPGIMIKTNLNLNYLMILQHRYKLFWLIFFFFRKGHLKKGVTLYFNKLEFTVVLETKWKMWKVYRLTDRHLDGMADGMADGKTDGQTDTYVLMPDKKWSEELVWAFSPGEPKLYLLAKFSNAHQCLRNSMI